MSYCAAGCPSKKETKVLFMVGGGFHDFKTLPPILAEKLNQTGRFKVTITEDRDELTAPKIAKYDVALFFTQGGKLTPEQEKGLTEFVASGKGYAGIHCASDSFPDSDAYFKLVGGRFSGHGRGTFPVHYTAKSNQVVKGLTDFEITDETYDHKFHQDAKVLVLARRATDSAPSVWIQYYGNGRVFFTGLGHGKEAFENPAFQELMVRGLTWAAKCDPPELKRGCSAH